MRNPTVKVYPYQCEALEIRRLLAGHVVAQVIDGDLVLAGDQYGNRVAVDQIDLPAGSVRITPYATTVNNANNPFLPQVFTGITRGIKVYMGQGDDVLTLHELTLPGGAELRTGSGNDRLMLFDVELGGDLFIRTRADADQAHIYDSRVGGDVTILGGRGADVVNLDGNTFAGDVLVETWRGRDSIATARNSSPRGLSLDVGPGVNLTTVDGTIRAKYDFANGDEGWQTGFADYADYTAVHGQTPEEYYGIEAGIRSLPVELGRAATGMYLSGDNLSDDLVMFLKRRLSMNDGLVPGRTYDSAVSVVFASNVAAGMDGIGGSPGESVWMKAGATREEPKAVNTIGNEWRLNINAGAQSRSGSATSVVGTAANGQQSSDEGAVRYHIVRHSATGTARVTVGPDGQLWLFVGTDSGFMGTTAIYYLSIDVTLTPVS